MLDRSEELSIFIERKWKLLELFDVADGMCGCHDPECAAPGKHPVKGLHAARAYRNTIALKKNVGVVCGEGFVVLDIDPRNGGTRTLADLEAQHGALPRTWEVATGGGGRHLYFRTADGESLHSQNRLKAQGVELKGLGSYVVAPTSMHVSGRVYEWEVAPDECELAPLPAWVLEATRTAAKGPDGGSGEPELECYTEEDVADALAALSPDCGYSEWVTVGMALHAANLPFETWDSWSAKSSKYPGRPAVARKWASFEGEGVGIGSLFHLAERAGWVARKLECPLILSTREQADEKPLPAAPPPLPSPAQKSALRLSAEGLVGELARWMYDTSVREYDELAVAGALAVLSVVAQGSYVSFDRRSLSLYQIALLPAAGGKDHYLSCVEDVVRNVDDRLMMHTPGSSHGLRSDMYAFNSRLLATDEVQDFFHKMSSTDNTFVSQVFSDIKELYNGKRKWSGQTLKAQLMPDISHPRLTWLGFGTPGRFKSTITSNTVGGGLLSRILLWDVENIPARHRTQRRASFDPWGIKRLREIALVGYQKEVTDKGDEGYRKALQEFHEGKNMKHIAQTCAAVGMGISPAAMEIFDDYDMKGEVIYRANPDTPGGAIMDRASTQVAKIACLHALGCGRTTVQERDVIWASQVADATVEKMAKLAETWMADGPQERDRRRIIDALERSRGVVSRRDAARSLRMGIRQFDSLVADLVAQGLVVVMQEGKPVGPARGGGYPADATIHGRLNPYK